MVSTLQNCFYIFTFKCRFFDNIGFFSLSDNQYPNKYATQYHYTDDPEPKQVADFAYEAALEVGKFEYEKVQEFLYSLPNSNELQYAYNETKSESKGALVEAWNDFKYSMVIFSSLLSSVLSKSSESFIIFIGCVLLGFIM